MRNKKLILFSVIIFLMILLFVFFVDYFRSYKKIIGERQVQYRKNNIQVILDKEVAITDFIKIKKSLDKLEKFEEPESLEISVMELYKGVQAKNGKIIVSPLYIDTPEFKKTLIREGYQLYDNWIVEGLYQYLFEKRKKEIDLSYFNNHDLSLFGARFFELFNEREEVEALKNVSYSLVKYILDKDRDKLLLGDIKWAHIEEWASENKIDISYYQEIFDVTRDIKVENRGIEKLFLSTKYNENGFDIRVVDMGEEWNSAFKLEQMLLLFAKENEALIQLIESEAPLFYSKHKEIILFPHRLYITLDSQYFLNLTKPIIRMSPEGSIQEEYVITLSALEAYMQERAHAILGVRCPIWLADALDDYLKGRVSENYQEALYIGFKESMENKDYFKEGYEKVLDKPYKGSLNQQIDYQIYENIIKKYQGRDISKDFFKDSSHIYDYLILVRFPKLESEYETIAPRAKSNTVDIFNQRVYSGIDEPNNLQISGLYGFVMYLVKTYGLDKMMELRISDLRGKTFEEVFGKSYKELLEDYEAEYYRIRKEEVEE